MKKITSSIVDWNEKDSIIYSKVNNEIHKIIKNNSLERITVNTINKLIDYKSLYKNLDKLPKTKSLIHKYYESPLDFNKRKLKITISNLKYQDVNLTTDGPT